jgi:hypothetical protein
MGTVSPPWLGAKMVGKLTPLLTPGKKEGISQID